MFQRLFGKRKRVEEVVDKSKKPRTQNELKQIEFDTNEMFNMMDQFNLLSWLDQKDGANVIETNKSSRMLLSLDKPKDLVYQAKKPHVWMIGKLHLIVKPLKKGLRYVEVDLSSYKSVKRITVDDQYNNYSNSFQINFTNGLSETLVELDLDQTTLTNQVELTPSLKHLTLALFPYWDETNNNADKLHYPGHVYNRTTRQPIYNGLETLRLLDFMLLPNPNMERRITKGMRRRTPSLISELNKSSYVNNTRLENLKFTLPSTRILRVRFPISTEQFTYDPAKLETLIINHDKQTSLYNNNVRFTKSSDLPFFPTTIRELIISRLENDGKIDFSSLSKLESLSFSATAHGEIVYPPLLKNLYARFANNLTTVRPVFPNQMTNLYYDLPQPVDLSLTYGITSAILRNVNQITNASSLKYLKITGEKYISSFKGFSNLETLILKQKSTNYESYLSLENLPKLRVLHVNVKVESLDVHRNLQSLKCVYNELNNPKLQFPNVKSIIYVSSPKTVEIKNHLPSSLKVLVIPAEVVWSNDDQIELQKFKADSLSFKDPKCKLYSHRVDVASIGDHLEQVVCVDLKTRSWSDLNEVNCTNLQILYDELNEEFAFPTSVQTLELRSNQGVAFAPRTLVCLTDFLVVVLVTNECEYLFLRTDRYQNGTFELNIMPDREVPLKVVVFGMGKADVWCKEDHPDVLYLLNTGGHTRIPKAAYLIAVNSSNIHDYDAEHVYITNTANQTFRSSMSEGDMLDQTLSKHQTFVLNGKVIKGKENSTLKDYAKVIPEWKRPFKSMKQFKDKTNNNSELYRLKKYLVSKSFLDESAEYESDDELPNEIVNVKDQDWASEDEYDEGDLDMIERV